MAWLTRLIFRCCCLGLLALVAIKLLFIATSHMLYWTWVLIEALFVIVPLCWLYSIWRQKQLYPYAQWSAACVLAAAEVSVEIKKLLRTAALLMTRVWSPSRPLLVRLFRLAVRCITGIVGQTHPAHATTTMIQELDDVTGLPQHKLQGLKQIMQQQREALRRVPDYYDRAMQHIVVARRARCLADSMRALPPASLALWEKPLYVDFRDEEGVDANGLKRAWVSVVGRELQVELFSRTGNEAVHEYFIAPAGSAGRNQTYTQLLDTYYWFGMLLGKILMENNRAWSQPLQLRLPFELAPIFYKLLIGGKPSNSDIERFDPEFYRGIFSEPDSLGAHSLFFVYWRRSRGGTQTPQPLKVGGANIAVTDANKEEYMQLYLNEVERGVMEQMDKVMEGFQTLLPEPVYQHLQENFTAEQLKLLFEGIHTIDLDTLRQAVVLQGYSPTDQDIKWFWDSMRNFSMEGRSSVLEWITGCNSIAGVGHNEVAFTIRRVGVYLQHEPMSTRRPHAMPVAHTCGKVLDLQPGYRTQQELQEALGLAVAHMDFACL